MLLGVFCVHKSGVLIPGHKYFNKCLNLLCKGGEIIIMFANSYATLCTYV